MDEVIWVEVLSRHRNVVSRHRCTGRGIRIGRAYTNDVILDDPYVAPEHVYVSRDQNGNLVAEDLGSANGLCADHGPARLDRIVLRSDTPFRVGNTYLRVRGVDHAVAGERVFAAQARSWPILIAIGAAVLAIETGSLWLDNFSEPRAADYVVPMLGVVAVAAAWTGLWAMASRVFTGQARFERHLLATLVGALGLEIAYELSELGAFGFSWSVLVTYRYVGFWCVLAALGFVHLRLINPANAQLKGAVVTALLASVIVVQTLMQFDRRPAFDQAYVRRLMPPALRLSPVEDEASFFAAVERLQDKLDKDRAEEP